MKKVRINAGKVGLVFKNGNYQKVITQGSHWLFLNQNVIVYDLTQEFYANVAIEILLKDTVLSELLEVIEVKDAELVLVYENNNFKRVLTAGRYFFWKGFIDRKFTKVDISKVYITEDIEKGLFSNFELNKYIRLFEVATFEKAILLIDDVLLELDIKKRNIFLSLLDGYSQVFFTFLPKESYFKEDEKYTDYITLSVKEGGFVKNDEG